MPARPAPAGIMALHFIPESPFTGRAAARHPGCERTFL